MTKRYEEFADAAGLILASIQDDTEVVHDILLQISTGDNAASELTAMLSRVVFAAAQAITKDLDQHLEQGEDTSEAIRYLVRLRSHANMTETD